MSAFRKTVLTTAIIGAGLASTSGAAFASEHHDGGHDKSSSAGCSNLIKADGSTGADRVRGDLLGATQTVDAYNLCDNFAGNEIGTGNNLAGGNIQNGNTTTNTKTTNNASTEGKNSPIEILSGLL